MITRDVTEWYEYLRDDQKQFIMQLRYSIASSTATKEYLEEMLRELCDVCDQLEKDLSTSQGELVPMLSRVLYEYIPDQQRTDSIATRIVLGYAQLRHQETQDKVMLKAAIAKLLENAQKESK